ncbi:MAG: (Fe-S)-binding protein [Thermoplasmata archaeon]
MCGYCAPVCPPYQEMGWESITPRAKMYYLKQYYLRGLSDRLLKRKIRINEKFAEAVYKCTSCGHCETVCPVDIPFQKRWDEIKQWLIDRQVVDFPEHRQVYENVVREHNIYAEPHEQRDAWIPEEARISRHPEVIFWVGCAQSYRQRSTARAVVKILNAAGVKYSLLGKGEWCTGAPLMRMGYVRYVRAVLAPHNVEEVASTGAKTLITACAECFRAFWRDYREMIGNPPFSVYHISQYVERLVKEKRLKLTKPLPKAVTLHDACHLGRNCGKYEEPRKALKLVPQAKLVEMARSRDETLCSGAGGGFNLVWEKEAARIARRRLEEAVKSGAEVLATTCPFAEEHMKEVARRANIPIETVDLVELIAESLEVEEQVAVPEAQSQR